MPVQGEPPSDTLRVSNLPLDCDEGVLKTLFGQGVREHLLLPTRSPGKGSPTALIRFFDITEAAHMRLSMDGSRLPGNSQALKVRFAPVHSIDKASRDFDDGLPNETVHVSGLPSAVSNRWLMEFFGQYGKVKDCKVLQPRNDVSSRHAFVTFASTKQATDVKEVLSGQTIPSCDEPLSINFSRPALPSDDPLEGHPPRKRAKLGIAQREGAPRIGAGGGGGGGSSGSRGLPLAWSESLAKEGSVEQGEAIAGGMDEILRGFMDVRVLPGSSGDGPSKVLCLEGLPPDCSEIHLFNLCSPFGAIAPIGIGVDRTPEGECSGSASIRFLEPEGLRSAQAVLHGCVMPDGQVMKALPKRPILAEGAPRPKSAGAPPLLPA